MSRRPRRNHTRASRPRWLLPPSRAIEHWPSWRSSSTSAPIRSRRGKHSSRKGPPMCSVRAAATEACSRPSTWSRSMPCVDGSELARTIFTSQRWSVQPCVRPVGAVHVTAGHNALRGSGPGQNPAFDNALAKWVVLIADRPALHYVLFALPTFTSRRVMPSATLLRRECDGFFVALAPGHDRPSHSGDFVGERDGGDLRRSPRQQSREPRPVLGAVDFGVTDHRYAPAVNRLRR